MRQPGHGPGCSVAKPSRTHSFTALVNHTAQVRRSCGVEREAQARRCGYDSQSSAANLITKPRASTLEAFQRAFEKAGVVFLEPGDIRDGGEGVRLKKPERRR